MPARSAVPSACHARALLVCTVALCCGCAAAAAPPKPLVAPLARTAPPHPHIFYLLVDDWGRASAGWRATANTTEVRTPHLNALVASGVELDRFYAHRFCSPTRSALQTGRNPIRVNVLNSELGQYNAADPVGGFEGIARNFTGIATLLKTAGYQTAAVGKWCVVRNGGACGWGG